MHTYAVVEENGFISAIHQTPDRYVEATADIRDDTHYFDLDSETIQPKATPDIQASVDGLVVTLTGVPVGAIIAVNGISDTADAETFEIDLEAPGAYQIRVYGVPAYREQTLTVEV
ncbi:hypothetical protein P3W43_01530 [Salinicola salarius]|uniref:hypothetical protein n=1 Tax=Salinicola salarius TaxID=430457 RepID=UPI0023E47907|nr:hypothetical protein [Salinicola salarius]MDF3917530.1 hypothetical protein [Salinicola salarius]